jgi:hypothetical protein
MTRTVLRATLLLGSVATDDDVTLLGPDVKTRDAAFDY